MYQVYARLKSSRRILEMLSKYSVIDPFILVFDCISVEFLSSRRSSTRSAQCTDALEEFQRMIEFHFVFADFCNIVFVIMILKHFQKVFRT